MAGTQAVRDREEVGRKQREAGRVLAAEMVAGKVAGMVAGMVGVVGVELGRELCVFEER